MIKLFIDIDPNSYIIYPGEKDGATALKRVTGNSSVKFFRNSLARLSDGDVYSVNFQEEEESSLFILKFGYPIIPTEKVISFLYERYKQYPNESIAREIEEIIAARPNGEVAS